MNDRMIARVVNMLGPQVLIECDSKALAKKIVNYVLKTVLTGSNE